MNDDDAFRERLAAMTPAEVAGLYSATKDDWLAIGISREVFTNDMRARADYDAAVRPLEMVYEAYVLMSNHEEVRAAKETWEQAVADLDISNPENASRPVAELTAAMAAEEDL